MTVIRRVMAIAIDELIGWLLHSSGEVIWWFCWERRGDCRKRVKYDTLCQLFAACAFFCKKLWSNFGRLIELLRRDDFSPDMGSCFLQRSDLSGSEDYIFHKKVNWLSKLFRWNFIQMKHPLSAFWCTRFFVKNFVRNFDRVVIDWADWALPQR